MIGAFRSRQVLRVSVILISVIFLISLIHNLRKYSDNEVSRTFYELSLSDIPDTTPEIHATTIGGQETTTQTTESLPTEKDEEWELDNENIPDLSMIMGKNNNGPKQFDPACAKFPDLYKVRFSNVHWQTQETQNETYYLYSAFLDVRTGKDLKNGGWKVRILGMSDGRSLTVGNATLTICQYWFPDEEKPAFGDIVDFKLMWNVKWGSTGIYYPYLITCQLPSDIKEVPLSVSVVSEKCDHATNNLNIIHKEQAALIQSERTPKNNFAVCVKALDFPDDKMKARFVEWIEMLRILGADTISFYEYFVDPNIKKLLNYYESQGVIEVTQTTLPGNLPNHPQLRHLFIRGKRLDKRLTELIPYNDCLYRHLYDYKYVLVIDTDELVVPVEDISWADLIEKINTEDIDKKAQLAADPVTNYCFRNFYFLDEMMVNREEEVAEIPPQFHALRHVYRSQNFTGAGYMKCFHNTATTEAVHNHFAFFCRDNHRCRKHFVDTKRAQMNHYRETCVADIKNCSIYLENPERDVKLWRYKEELIPRVEHVLNNIT